MNYVKRLFEFLSPNPDYYVPAVFLLGLVVILVLLIPVPKLKGQRANLVLGIVLLSLLLTVMAVDFKRRWQWSVGLLPTILVVYQAFFLWLYQPKETDGKPVRKARYEPRAHEDTANAEIDLSSIPAQQPKMERFAPEEKAYKRAQDTISTQFGLKTLFIRYGLPAVLLGITGMIILDILVEPARFFSLVRIVDDKIVTDENVTKILLGTKLGAVGAYIYVLLELGRRTFRHDVTGASAMWCLVTLVLGPVLAGTVAVLWRMDPPPSTGWWGSGVILFFTGFAPRRVIAAIEQAAIQLLKVGGQNAVVETRLVPLSKIRGISPQIEERLGEEGILDVNALSAAEPIRLVRNTSFDMRQILCWIDEAVLIVTLPKSWESLEEQGITGVIDLVWYYDQLFDPKTGVLLEPIPQQIKGLAEKAKIEPANLVAIIRRLHEYTQVQYIWALYNNFTEYSGGGPVEANVSRQNTDASDEPAALT